MRRASSTRLSSRPSDELGELLLRGDDDPHLASADATEVLHDGLKVEHLLDVARHELADLVDDEQEILAGAAATSSAPCREGPESPGVMSARFIADSLQLSASGIRRSGPSRA